MREPALMVEIADEGYITWFEWLRSGPQPEPDPLADATEIGATCGDSKVYLRKEETRWLMYVDTLGKLMRRRDFASPFREHAQRTAEFWYGTSQNGWHKMDHFQNKSGAKGT